MDLLGLLKRKYNILLPYLNEKQKRLMLAAEAKALGRGGILLISKASGISRPTIHKGIFELESLKTQEDRIRKKGGGRKTVKDLFPGIESELEKIVEPDVRGDPMSPLRWTCKSTRNIADILTERGFKVRHNKVKELLHELDYSLKGNKKTLEGSGHPDRDSQFRYIDELVKVFLNENLPVVSVDTKKKELIGEYKNNGREWSPKGEPIKVKTHDSPDKEKGKVVPYGVYDVFKNVGWVNVGISHDTAQFAVASIKSWWTYMGKISYKDAKKILICADGGGSNGYRTKLWKTELQKWADKSGFEITVCHYPPGTSKWNKIEHRLFSHITMNWRAKPLTSYEVVINLIGSTTTKKGLKVKAKLDKRFYPAKLKVEKDELNSLNLYRHEFHGEWNYTIISRK